MANRIWIAVSLVLCLAYEAYGTVDCTTTGAGRFPEPSDTTCKQYTFCVYDSSTSTYLAYNYTCPTTSLFNPSTGACTTNYVCSVNSTNSTTSTSVCTADGYIADASSTDCSSYVQCVEVNGVFIGTIYPCPNNTYYNPNSTLCETGYSCPLTSTFSCTAAGRFANDDDSTCKTYYMCVLMTDGSFVQYNYTCPSTSVFSPISKACTTSYFCFSFIPVDPA